MHLGRKLGLRFLKPCEAHAFGGSATYCMCGQLEILRCSLWDFLKANTYFPSGLCFWGIVVECFLDFSR